MKCIINKILVLLLVLIAPSIAEGAGFERISIKDGRMTGTVTAIFGKGTQFESDEELLLDCAVPDDSYTPEIFRMGYRYIGKADVQRALWTIGQNDEGTYICSEEGTTYIHTAKIDPSARISKEEAERQAVEIGIQYFEALGIDVVKVPVSIERPYDLESYMEQSSELYSHAYSDTSSFMKSAEEQWKKTHRYETRTPSYTRVTFAVMVDGMRVWTQPSYPAGYSDEPGARVGFEVSACVLVSDSGVLVEASTSYIPEIKGTRRLEEGEKEHHPILLNGVHRSPLIRADNWQEGLSTVLQDASGIGGLTKNAEDRPFQNRQMSEPIAAYGYQTVITDIYPCLSTISKDEWAMFWHIDCQQQFSDGWRY